MIRFPNKPMADSVVDRIMALMRSQEFNSVPAQGARIEAALQQPAQDVAPVEGIENDMIYRALGL